MWHRLAGDDHGVALIFTLFAALTLSGIAVVLVSVTITETRATGAQRNFEAALHVAEAGADAVIATINPQDDYVTKTSSACPNGIEYSVATVDSDGDGVISESEERAWAIDRVDACDLDGTDVDEYQSGTRGIAYGFRPVESTATGVPLDVVFGVSYVPFKGAPDQDVRVVKLQYDREVFGPSHGLQTCGDLKIAGNAKVAGTLGSVRSNGDVTISGGSYSIEQALIASGAISGDTSGAGVTEAGSPDEFCPEIDASDFYANSQNPAYRCYDNPGDAAAGCAVSASDVEPSNTSRPILWWDLCPAGVIRRASGTPCTGTVQWTTGDTNNFNGWKYQGGDWKAPNGLSTGIYYVYRENVDINGGGGAVTVFVEADPADGGLTGNLGMRGNGRFVPAVPEVLLIADRDLEMNGSAGGGGLRMEGWIGVGEQVKLDGTATIAGSIYAQDRPHTPSSPVDVSSLGGNYTINHNTELNPPIRGIVRVIAWNELRR